MGDESWKVEGPKTSFAARRILTRGCCWVSNRLMAHPFQKRRMVGSMDVRSTPDAPLRMGLVEERCPRWLRRARVTRCFAIGYDQRTRGVFGSIPEVGPSRKMVMMMMMMMIGAAFLGLGTHPSRARPVGPPSDCVFFLNHRSSMTICTVARVVRGFGICGGWNSVLIKFLVIF